MEWSSSWAAKKVVRRGLAATPAGDAQARGALEHTLTTLVLRGVLRTVCCTRQRGETTEEMQARLDAAIEQFAELHALSRTKLKQMLHRIGLNLRTCKVVGLQTLRAELHDPRARASRKQLKQLDWAKLAMAKAA